MALRAFIRDLRSYYRGSRGRDLREFYDLESRLPYFDQVGRILCAHKRRLLLSWIAARPPRGPILELGGGIGTFARQLGRHGYRVLSVDISEAKIRKARAITARRFAGRPSPVEHIRGDLRTLGDGGALDQRLRRELEDRPSIQLDAVVAADVLEHLPEAPLETVRRVRRLLAPGGRLLASVPSRLCLNDPGHLWKMLPREWEEVFRQAGLGVRRRRMSRICWMGLPTPLPLAMVFELATGAPHPVGEKRCE